MLDEKDITDQSIKDMQALLDLSNGYISSVIKTLDPRKYAENTELFTQTCISGPAIIAASIIDIISGTFHVKKEAITEEFIIKLRLATKWVDYKNKDKE